MVDARFSTSGLYCSGAEDYIKVLQNMGSVDPRTVLCERLKKYHSCDYVVLFNTGFWSLVGSVKLSLVNKQLNGVLMPSLTYRRLADAVFWAGGTPVFCEVESKTLGLDPIAVSQALQKNENISTLLLVQPIVGTLDLQIFIDLCKEFKISLVVDSVESVHDMKFGRRCGSWDIPEVFSLHASKFINGFEGGYVTTNDHAYYIELLEYSRSGGDFNLGISPFHASIAVSNLKEADHLALHNYEIYQTYLDETSRRLRGRLSIVEFEAIDQCGYKNIVARLDNDSIHAKFLVEHLNMRGIGARGHYQPPLHTKSYAYPVIQIGQLEFTEDIGKSLLNLPCGWRLKKEDVATVIECIEEFFDDLL